MSHPHDIGRMIQ